MRKNVKKWLVTIGIVAALFTPVYIAVISYFIINSLPEPIIAEQYLISVISPSGEELPEEDAESLKEMFLRMRRDAAECSEVNLAGGYSYSVSISGKENAEFVFVFFDDGRGYMTEDGLFFELGGRDVESFLSGKYAAELFPNSSLPSLLSEGTHKILPYSAEWKYSGYGGKTVSADVEVRDHTVTYNYEEKIGLSFSSVPDECTIRVLRGGEELYNGDFSGYLDLRLDETIKLEYEIEASWSQNNCSGNAKYHFFADLGKPAEFEAYFGEYDDKYLEFVLINGQNIGIPEDATIKVEPALSFKPSFFADGAVLRALIPFGENEKEGEYKIITSYGNVTEEFKFEYIKRAKNSSSNPYPEERREVVEKYRKAYLDAIKEIGEISSDTLYMGNKFLDPEDPDGEYGGACSLLVGFGRIRSVGDSELEYVNDGVVYQCSGAVYAVNGGKVIKTGENDWLGKYVVVDHGLGLRTWYANLMSIDVREGNTLRRGQQLGMAGNSGFANKNSLGFYFMATVGATPISPYSLLEDGIKIE